MTVETLIRGLTQERVNDGPLLLRLHYTADPGKDPGTEKGRSWVESAAKSYPDGGTMSPGWRREMEMDVTAGAGELVFPYLDRLSKVMFTRGFKPTFGDALFAGFDVGRTNPTALLAAAMRNVAVPRKAEGGRIVHVQMKALFFFWEYYKRHALLNEMAQAVTNCPWYPGFQWIACDPSIWDRNQYKKDGMVSLDTMLQEEVEPQYRIEKMMKAHGRNDQVFVQKFATLACNVGVDEKTGEESPFPLVYVDEEGCPNFCRELRGAKYRESSVEVNASEKIVDKDNHLIDCAKYITLSHPETHEVVTRHVEGTIGDVREKARIAQLRSEEYQEAAYGW